MFHYSRDFNERWKKFFLPDIRGYLAHSSGKFTRVSLAELKKSDLIELHA